MSECVPATEQLAVEVYVRDLAASLAFYTVLGFGILRQEADFAELEWEGCIFMLEAVADQPPPPARPVANVRIMVPDVDAYWQRVQDQGVPILLPIEDRYYGLRDFTIVSPDGIGLRFASPLAGS